MKNYLKIFIAFIICFTFINWVFASKQWEIKVLENKIIDYNEELEILENEISKYGKIKDIKYYEKLFEKYEFLEKKERKYGKALIILEKCKIENEICNFLDLESSISFPDLRNLINKSDNELNNYRRKKEKLSKNLEYLHKSQREIELREKFENTKNKFEAEKSDKIIIVKNKLKENTKNKKIKKEKKNEEENKKLEKKLDNLLKKYSKKEKINIYLKILKKIRI